MKPVMVGEPPSQRLRIGFVARRSIARGDELFFNYGVKDKNLPWLTANAKESATTLKAARRASKKSIPKNKVVYYIQPVIYECFLAFHPIIHCTYAHTYCADYLM